MYTYMNICLLPDAPIICDLPSKPIMTCRYHRVVEFNVV